MTPPQCEVTECTAPVKCATKYLGTRLFVCQRHYMAQYRRDVAYKRTLGRHPDPDAVRAKLRELNERGISTYAVAKELGASHTALFRLNNGQSKTVTTPLGDAVLGIDTEAMWRKRNIYPAKTAPPAPPEKYLVSAEPSRRKLRALAVAGVPFPRVVDRVGMHRTALIKLRAGTGNAHGVTRETADKIDAAYNELEREVDSGEVSRDQETVTRSLRRKWHASAAWDDINDLACIPFGTAKTRDLRSVEEVARSQQDVSGRAVIAEERREKQRAAKLAYWERQQSEPAS